MNIVIVCPGLVLKVCDVCHCTWNQVGGGEGGLLEVMGGSVVGRIDN